MTIAVAVRTGTLTIVRARSGCTMDERLVDCAPHRPDTWAVRRYREATLGQFDRQDRRQVAVVVTADGRRVHVPVDPSGLEDLSVLALLRSLLSLDGLLGLITGSRRENGGTRRTERG